MQRNIDLLKVDTLSREELQLISLVIQQYPKRRYKAGRQHLIEYQDKKIHVHFSQEIIRYRRDPAGKHQGEYKYAIRSQQTLGQGGFSKVEFLPYILLFNHGSLEVQKKSRALKLVLKNFDSKSPRHSLENEVSISPKELRMKPVRKYGRHYGSVLKYLSGEDLNSILHEDRKLNEDKRLNAESRIKLLIATIHAYKTQVAANNLVHRDIKPDNIRVDFNIKTNDFDVIFFDFGHSKKSDKDDADFRYAATNSYSPPDHFKAINSCTKSDIWVLACIFSEILGCNRTDQDFDPNKLLRYEWTNNRVFNYEGFCEEFPDSQSLPRRKLNNLIADMSRTKPEDRIDLAEIEARLHEVKERFNCLQKLHNYHSTSSLHRSRSLPTMHTSNRQPEEAKKLIDLVHGKRQHGFTQESVKCKELASIVSLHAKIIDSHLSAPNASKPPGNKS